MNTKKHPGIPQVEKLITTKEIAAWIPRISRPLVLRLIRGHLDQARRTWQDEGTCPEEAALIHAITDSCERTFHERALVVINCTGVLIHTNLGRAPIDRSVWDAVREANTRYVSLEYDVPSGKRGRRNALISPLLAELTAADGAVVVNNNAAALLLTLSTFAKGKEVIVSRGELVQIGGGFRIPEILEESGAILVPVGTTNITTVEDYLHAITDQTAMVLKVHSSNFAIRGFTAEPDTRTLVQALPAQVITVVDQGSGVLHRGTCGELTVREHIEASAALVTFSTDKVLGSVQSGCIVGRRDLLQQLERHPLYRVLRPGKTVLTILEQTLINQLNGEQSSPIRMLSRNLEELRHIGEVICAQLPRHRVSLVETPMTLGGGSAPDEFVNGIALRLSLDISAEEGARRLRNMTPPIIGKVERDALILHLGALADEEITTLTESLKLLLKG